MNSTNQSHGPQEKARVALTLHRPWPWAVFHAGKDVENRTWAPPKWLVGRRLAIHAGKKFDRSGAAWIESTFGIVVPPESQHPTGIIGSVRLTGVADGDDLFSPVESDWFVGAVGWLLADPQECAVIPCRGHQGLWPIGNVDLVPKV